MLWSPSGNSSRGAVPPSSLGDSLASAGCPGSLVSSSSFRRSAIGPKEGGITLTAIDTPGRFTFSRLVEESKEGRTGEVITRIIFVPDRLEKQMSLQFGIG